MTPRFSGHETFPCRYAWLPKAYGATRRLSDRLRGRRGSDDHARRREEHGQGHPLLGPGGGDRAVAARRGVHITPFGKAIFGRRGHDPFLEDARTLWLIHWQLAAHVEEPLFAWDFLLNRWPNPEFGGAKCFARSSERPSGSNANCRRSLSSSTSTRSSTPTSRRGAARETSRRITWTARLSSLNSSRRSANAGSTGRGGASRLRVPSRGEAGDHPRTLRLLRG